MTVVTIPTAERPTVAPPVVAVMVIHEPGGWFEETLASLAAQASGQVLTFRAGPARPGHFIVRINDRGPFIRGRIIDLSYGAAKVVGLTRSGVAKGRTAPTVWAKSSRSACSRLACSRRRACSAWA